MHSLKIFVATSAITLALATAAHAGPGIAAAAIAAGRLYVVGTTDKPHTIVSLDEKFTAESDDKGKFQFDLVYYPSGCVVRAKIGAETYQARVEQCGMKCEPERVASAETAPAKRAKPSKAPVTKPLAALQPAPTENLTPDAAAATPQSPAQTGTLPAQLVLIAKPIAHPPLPPQRPAVLSAVNPAAPIRTALPPTPAAGPKLKPQLRQREEPSEPVQQEQSDDPEQPADLR
ncbi:hypothetical protein [Methylobacterium sp.]|uniref:hypothetical protein n=1 Tax=Methylobacterium sp. TaxID=409 RepID=UPI003B00A4FB